MKIRFITPVLVLTLVSPAAAQMVPDKDLRDLHAKAYWNAIPPDLQTYIPAFFATMDTSLNAFTEDGLGSGAGANAQQFSSFLPNRIDYNGLTGGYWAGDPSGHYDAVSLADLRVQIPTCVEYLFFGSVDPVNGAGYCTVRSGLLKYLYVDHDTMSVTGRLPSGTYDIEARSDAISAVPYMDGAIYELGWQCNVCGTSNIAVQPGDKSMPYDSTTTFCVTPTTPSGTTYQWRRDLQALSNSAHITGATSSCLSILHTAYPDTGQYDVVVTTGSVAEPSRLAHLTVQTTGIDDRPGSALRGFALGPASPNPFGSSTACRYDAPQRVQAAVAVFDADGRLVRRLSQGILSGSGTLVWDGATESGARAAAGIYFMRVSVSTESRTRRIALLR